MTRTHTLITGVLLSFNIVAQAQTVYDSKTLVDTNNTSTNTVNSNNVNTNTNINDTTVNSTNTNINTNTNNSTSTNTNYNYGHTTSANTNTNINTNNSTSTSTQDVRTNNINDNRNTSDIRQRIEQPPPTAIAPSMMSGGNNDLCTTGVSGAVQTQILGFSGGGTVRDLNCERLKNAKTLYDMGMKVAAVATLCQDRRVFDAMWNAGTPCPYEGMIGEQAKAAWQANPDRMPRPEKEDKNDGIKTLGIGAIIGALFTHFVF